MMNKPQRNNPTHADKRTSMAEVRFNKAIRLLRTELKSKLSTEQQVDLAYAIHEAQTYGFSFFPNHYAMDAIERIEKIAKEMKYGASRNV